MVLDHLVVVVQGLTNLAGPAANRVRTHAEQVEAAEERAGGHDRVFVHDGLLDVALGLREKRGLIMTRQDRGVRPGCGTEHEDCSHGTARCPS